VAEFLRLGEQLIESGLNVVAKLVKHRDSDPSGVVEPLSLRAATYRVQ